MLYLEMCLVISGGGGGYLYGVSEQYLYPKLYVNPRPQNPKPSAGQLERSQQQMTIMRTPTTRRL